MKKEERQQTITQILQSNGSVSVTDLVKTLNVSRETVRSDLQYLESEGVLHRTFGGAIYSNPVSSEYHNEVPYYERERINQNAKIEIAQVALDFIVKNDRIFLDSSSTCVYLARALPNMPLVVLTNSVRIVSELASKDKIEIICTGGLLLRSSMCFVAQRQIGNIAQHNVRTAFISCSGITKDGATESHELAVLAKNDMMNSAERIFLLVDHSKFGVKDFVRLAPLDAFSEIIVDYETNDAQIQALAYPLSRINRSRRG